MDNILERAAREQAAFTHGIKALSGYETFTTFWADLTIAEAYGVKAVRETYETVVKSWSDNYKYFTEFVLVLNHKIWHYYKTNDEFATLYDELWRAADAIAAKWTGEAAAYYFEITD